MIDTNSLRPETFSVDDPALARTRSWKRGPSDDPIGPALPRHRFLNRGCDTRSGGYDTRSVLSVIPKMPLRSQHEPDAMRPARPEATVPLPRFAMIAGST